MSWFIGSKSNNVAIVVDDKDFLARWLHELVNTLASIGRKEYTEDFKIDDLDNKSIMSPSKVVFLLSQESGSIKEKCVAWLQKFTETPGNNPSYRIIHVQNDPESKEDVKGILEDNIIRIKDITEIYSWWPKVSAFLFDISKSKMKSCYVLNLSTNFEEASTWSRMMKTAVRDIGVPQADILADADIVVCFFKDDQVDLKSMEAAALRRAKMQDKPVHCVLFEGEEVSMNCLLTTTYQHFVHDKTPLRPFLCVLSDLRAGENLSLYLGLRQVINEAGDWSRVCREHLQ